MKRLLLAGIVLTLAAGSAGAANWKKIGRSDDGNIYFLDTASIQQRDGLIQVMAKIEDPENDSPAPNVKRMTALHYVNCRNQSYAVTQVTLYAANGKPLAAGRAVPLALLDFHTPEPGSFVDAVSQILCTRNPFTERFLAPK